MDATNNKTINLTYSTKENLIDKIASSSPWLASVVPSYLAFESMFNVLKFPWYIALTGAVVVETIGISTIHTYFTLRDYNFAKRKSDPMADLKVPFLTVLFYFVSIILVNVLLDNSILIQKVAKGLLSSFTVIGAITISVRSTHWNRLSEIKAEKERIKKKRDESKSAKSENKQNSNSLEAKSSEIQSTGNPLVCKVCERKFATQNALNAHHRIHTKSKQKEEQVTV